ncbi:hypothetical protein [Caulobacter hibisci]|uniref:Lipoprotein n=1 Tax=Caulobacter hibisci TaxID=2035993 RepID=A0ABS0T3I1_9CAUL|nr:hypothetical protein [Caulobacter hibisci]MBI1685402.1 hypothetical protein [Caulobacter hibisci]
MSRFLALAAALFAAPWSLAACSAAPTANAAVGRPAERILARDAAAERCPGLQLVARLDGYTPPRSGQVDLVFALVTNGGVQTLGRTAVFPQAPFSTGKGDPPQSFGFRVDRQGLGDGKARLRLTLEPVAGDGGGAGAVLGEARLAAIAEGGC